VRRELGLGNETLVMHLSNLRPLKRIDVLLEAVARLRPREAFKLVILAGADFGPHADQVRRLHLEDRVIVRERVPDVENFLQAADLGLYTSDNESFCLAILEEMCFGCPSVATRVGGIPEVVEDGVSGLLVPAGDVDALARAVQHLLDNPVRRVAMGQAARTRAQEQFSADRIVPRYVELYRRVCA
jgi:glycosyltransferase involved in cell wall biosynthesis